MRFLPAHAQHIGDRESQEDSFGFSDPGDRDLADHGGFVAVVCDGMGGMEHGDLASRTAVKVFLDAYSRKIPLESIPDALERSARAANDEVLSLARGLSLAESVGTTLVAAALHRESLYFISIGDSGIFYVSNGAIRPVNRPHTFANFLEQAVARGAISREDAEKHPERESLTSFIGVEKLAEIDRNREPWPVRPGDSILLASDGLFKTLDLEEIQACLQAGSESRPEALVAWTLAKQQESQDNVTVLMIGLESDAQASSNSQVDSARNGAPALIPNLPPLAVQAGIPRLAMILLWILLALVVATGVGVWWYVSHVPHRACVPAKNSARWLA